MKENYKGLGSYAFKQIIKTKEFQAPTLDRIFPTGEIWVTVNPHTVFDETTFSVDNFYFAFLYALKESHWDKHQPQLFEMVLDKTQALFENKVEFETVKKFFREKSFNFPGIKKATKMHKQLIRKRKNQFSPLLLNRISKRIEFYSKAIEQYSRMSSYELEKLERELRDQFPVVCVIDPARYIARSHNHPHRLGKGIACELSSSSISIEAVKQIYVSTENMNEAIDIIRNTEIRVTSIEYDNKAKHCFIRQ
ncbi:MAG: hypothetical protein COU06_02830 [Candidatus Harrisonbacteria bacterium CG10_big_fil_rev_8_21_14_0_10_38_8]|uniref:Uncharacterized protein n=1 Tax=Candidatus Harrisonbacteria bacterium CG10_big_fil_rev_8_21_14_0_10_38_8 TaxID=1974582 RepID=A0A2M6WJD8_9BACT|nr:MAG: hypothetical protein COU06_02830 [Candidatus Harrisonbacteria bacterium CG10_big_fil_rev_8_21_14_0_10_38_8]